MGDLIPGLPDDLATECLIRMHFESFPNAVLTCKNWKHIIGSPGYLRRRIVGGHSQSIVVMTLKGHHFYVEDSEREPAPDRVVVFELKTGIWSELPLIPGYFNLSIGRNMAVVGLNLVVIGRREVFIYSFISNTWRRGADILDALLYSWCVSDSDRTVYVVGMFFYKEKQMMSASAYDVAKDDWVKLPDMDTEVAKGQVEKVTFLSGKLHVFRHHFSGGKYVESKNLYVQTFDPATLTWGMVCKYLLPLDGCVSNPKVAGNVHVCKEAAVIVIANEKCQKIADLPIGGCDADTMLTWNKHLVVYTMTVHREIIMVRLLDLESKEWSNLEAPKRSYSEYVESVCAAEI